MSVNSGAERARMPRPSAKANAKYARASPDVPQTEGTLVTPHAVSA